MPASPALVRKLQTLLRRLDEALGVIAGHGGQVEYDFDPVDFSEWFTKWAAIRAELKATDPELADIQETQIPPPTRDSNYRNYFEGRGNYLRPTVERLRAAARDAWDIVSHPSRAVAQISLDREGIFVGGQPFDAMIAITSIMRAATKSIDVIDGYVSENTLALLSGKIDAVQVNILTSARSANAAFVQHARAFVAQFGAGPPLSVRTSTAFHDRFVVIDDADYYHFGASIKDAGRRNAFMFSRIEEPSVVSAFKTVWTREWNAGAVIAL